MYLFTSEGFVQRYLCNTSTSSYVDLVTHCAVQVDWTDKCVQEYKAHDRSRESIEMALDEILKQKMKIRHKYGFKPPKSGRRSDVEGDPTVRLELCVQFCACKLMWLQAALDSFCISSV